MVVRGVLRSWRSRSRGSIGRSAPVSSSACIVEPHGAGQTALGYSHARSGPPCPRSRLPNHLPNRPHELVEIRRLGQEGAVCSVSGSLVARVLQQRGTGGGDQNG